MMDVNYRYIGVEKRCNDSSLGEGYNYDLAKGAITFNVYLG